MSEFWGEMRNTFFCFNKQLSRKTECTWLESKTTFYEHAKCKRTEEQVSWSVSSLSWPCLEWQAIKAGYHHYHTHYIARKYWLLGFHENYIINSDLIHHFPSLYLFWIAGESIFYTFKSDCFPHRGMWVTHNEQNRICVQIINGLVTTVTVPCFSQQLFIFYLKICKNISM